MIGFGLLVLLLGVLLLVRPEIWWHLTLPADKKGARPNAPALKKLRLRGFVLTLGGIALVVVQYFKA